MAGAKGVFNCYFLISLVLTFGVNHRDLVVGDNDASILLNLEARVAPTADKKVSS